MDIFWNHTIRETKEIEIQPKLNNCKLNLILSCNIMYIIYQVKFSKHNNNIVTIIITHTSFALTACPKIEQLAPLGKAYMSSCTMCFLSEDTDLIESI